MKTVGRHNCGLSWYCV